MSDVTNHKDNSVRHSWRHPWRPSCLQSLFLGATGSIAALAVTSCGHYGVDYGGSRDASVDATEEKTKDRDKTSGAAESQPSDTKSDASTRGETKPGKPTRPFEDAGPGSETARDGGSHSGDGTESIAAPSSDTLDASADGGRLDDGGVRRDAGSTESETSRDVPNPLVDGGNPLCEPHCDCPIGGDCELLCLQSDCTVTCASETECQILVGPAASVELECGAGAVCVASGIASSAVGVTCHGEGECETQCEDGQHCEVTCQGPGKCVTQCNEEATCDVTCVDGAECYVVHDDRENVELTCQTGAVKPCDGYLTCQDACL